MVSLLLVLQFIFAILITIAVLIQKSSSIGLGAYSGSNESLFGAKGPTGFLTKFTVILAILFIVNALTLGHFYQKDNKKSVLDNIKIETTIPVDNQNKQENTIPQAPSIPAPAVPDKK